MANRTSKLRVTSTLKLARIGTGTVRLSDETKERVLRTFHTLMILSENLDRDSQGLQPTRQAPNRRQLQTWLPLS